MNADPQSEEEGARSGSESAGSLDHLIARRKPTETAQKDDEEERTRGVLQKQKT